MRVLVTGHEGYLGTVMCQVLAQAGHDVTGLDVGLFADCQLGPAPTVRSALRLDIRDVVSSDLRDFDAVVHLAAVSNDPLGEVTPQVTYKVNHEASLRLARAARDAGARRFLFASTCGVYGMAETDTMLGEDAPVAPITHYAASKVTAEAALREMAGANFEPVILRNATAFGYSARQRADIVVNSFAASAHLTGVVRVLSDGTPWRPLVHVRDIAAAFLAALDAPGSRVSGQAINIGGPGANLQVAQIAEVVAAVAGARVDITNESGPDLRSYRVDFSRSAELLPEYRPAWTIERGATELLAAYRRHLLTGADLERYHRLAHLRRLQAAGRVGPDMRWIRDADALSPADSG